MTDQAVAGPPEGSTAKPLEIKTLPVFAPLLEDYEERAGIKEYLGAEALAAETQSWVEAFANGD